MKNIYINSTTIQQIENSLTAALQTRYNNYNAIKNHIASLYSTMNIQRVDSSRKISQFLNIPKSIVSRAIIQLEMDGFISKVRVGTHPRHSWYIVRVSKQECFLYRNYHSLSPFRKKKFLKNLTTCGANSIHEITKTLNERGSDFYRDSMAMGE